MDAKFRRNACIALPDRELDALLGALRELVAAPYCGAPADALDHRAA